MNDKQRDALYSDEAVDAFGIDAPPARVHTQKKNRQKEAVLKPPTLLQQQGTPKEEEGRAKANVVNGTVSTCLQACTGAVYDFWNWKNMPGKPSTKMHTIVTRGGRAPYLLLTFVSLVVLVFCAVLCARHMRSNNLPPPRYRPRAPPSAYNNNLTIGPTIPPSAPPAALEQVQTMFQRTAPAAKEVANSVLRMAPLSTYKYA
jgi:hypothetical protein